jgi:hypothetical protein
MAASSFKSYNYAQAVSIIHVLFVSAATIPATGVDSRRPDLQISYSKFDKDIYNMMSCKTFSEIVCFKFEALFSSHGHPGTNHAILALFL